MATAMIVPRWLWLFPVLAGVRSVAWLLAAGWSVSPIGAVPSTLLVGGLSAAGVGLVFLTRPQPAPSCLGALFMLSGGAFAGSVPAGAADAAPIAVLGVLDPSVFSVPFAWALASVLPRVPRLRPGRSVASRAILLGGVSALGLFLEDALRRTGIPYPPGWPGAATMTTVRWLFVYLGISAALAYMARRLRFARPDEKRRGSVFLAGLIAGASPTLLGSVVLLVVPGWADALLSSPPLLRTYRLLSWTGLLLIPAITLYAVLADRALGVRDITRVAIRSALTRHVARVLTAVPVLTAALMSWRIFDAGGSVGLASVPLAAGVMLTALAFLVGHGRVLAFVDRNFFPELARREDELDRLRTGLRTVPSRAELDGLVRSALSTGLLVERAFVMREDQGRDRMVAEGGEAVPLPLDPRTSDRLRGGGGVRPRRAGLGEASSPDLQAWSRETGIELLIPIPGPGPCRVLAVGEKTSGLPLTREDERGLLEVARSIASALERVEAPFRGEAGSTRTALECELCFEVLEGAGRTCRACGVEGRAAPLPQVVAGKYRVLRRRGAGGTSVVYEADDLDLERRVALKTLPRTTSEGVQHLRREARFMASLGHPNVAAIHGLEVWQGTPILVLELFEEGSLADRLRARGGLGWQRALTVGLELARGLEFLHANRLIHGDVKPSNVGFRSEGLSKLLDFGLSGPDRGYRGGTAVYLPPEGPDGRRDGVSGDLWGLAVTIWEAIAGSHPFGTGGTRVVVARAAIGALDAGGRLTPGCPEAFAGLLRAGLAADPLERPASAKAMRESLEDVLRRTRSVTPPAALPPTILL